MRPELLRNGTLKRFPGKQTYTVQILHNDHIGSNQTGLRVRNAQIIAAPPDDRRSPLEVRPRHVRSAEYELTAWAATPFSGLYFSDESSGAMVPLANYRWTEHIVFHRRFRVRPTPTQSPRKISRQDVDISSTHSTYG